MTGDRTHYGALRWVHATQATDLTFEPLAAGELSGFADILTNLTSRVPNGAVETVTSRD